MVYLVPDEEFEFVECPGCGDEVHVYDRDLEVRQCSRCWYDQRIDELLEDRAFCREQAAKNKAQSRRYPDTAGRTFEQIIADFWRIFHGRPEVPPSEKSTSRQMGLFGERQ